MNELVRDIMFLSAHSICFICGLGTLLGYAGTSEKVTALEFVCAKYEDLSNGRGTRVYLNSNGILQVVRFVPLTSKSILSIREVTRPQLENIFSGRGQVPGDRERSVVPPLEREIVGAIFASILAKGSYVGRKGGWEEEKEGRIYLNLIYGTKEHSAHVKQEDPNGPLAKLIRDFDLPATATIATENGLCAESLKLSPERAEKMRGRAQITIIQVQSLPLAEQTYLQEIMSQPFRLFPLSTMVAGKLFAKGVTTVRVEDEQGTLWEIAMYKERPAQK